MVFRKPYAFLIKHFKLIHLIITFVLGYLVSCNSKIYSFLNDCISDSVNKYNALSYIDYSILIYILLGMGLFFVIYWLFKYKDKPRNLYVFSILGYAIVGMFMLVLFSYLGGLPNDPIDQKVIRMYRDLMLITLGFQYLIIIIMFIRGLGFNIKKFNFDKDIQELNLSEEDAEEVEVDVNIDTTGIMRNVRKKKRELGYFYQEFKVFIIGILAVLLVVVLYNGYNYFSEKLKVYKQNEVIGNINYVNIKNSYYSINNNKNYIIVKFDAFRNGKSERLNVNNMILKVDKQEYLPNKNICYLFDKIGNCYKKQYIGRESKNYILAYEVDDLNGEKTYLLYKETYEDTFKVKLNLESYE